MPTSTRQVSCEFIRADVGIRPYDADFNTEVNYNLKNQIWASYLQIIIKPTSVIAENYNLLLYNQVWTESTHTYSLLLIAYFFNFYTCIIML